MNIILLIISLVVSAIGIVTVVLGYKKDKTNNPQAAAILGKRIFTLALVVAVLNSVVPLINHFKPSPPPTVTEEQVENLFIKYSDQLKKPSIEEVKTDIEKEFRAISLKKEEEALELYRKGDFAYNERRFTTAVFYYSEVLKKIESASVYLTKGNALIFLGRKDEAIVAYEKALDIKPDYAEACYNKGVALGDLGRMDEAIVAFEKSLEIKPDYADAWNNKGFVLGDLGRKDKALVAYEKALEIKPDYAEAQYNKGSALADLGRKDEAIAAYEKALEILASTNSPHIDLVKKTLAEIKSKK